MIDVILSADDFQNVSVLKLAMHQATVQRPCCLQRTSCRRRLTSGCLVAFNRSSTRAAEPMDRCAVLGQSSSLFSPPFVDFLFEFSETHFRVGSRTKGPSKGSVKVRVFQSGLSVFPIVCGRSFVVDRLWSDEFYHYSVEFRHQIVPGRTGACSLLRISIEVNTVAFSSRKQY